MPGNGPSLDGLQWIKCRLTKEGTPFLVDNEELGREFRDLFLSKISLAVRSGEIKLEDAGYIDDLLDDLAERDWVVFIEGPPRADCPPDRLLKYLTRYITGGPISDKRIVGEKGGRIYFMLQHDYRH